MEFFLKEHTFNQVVLQSYSDYSRKIIAQRKYNQQAILAKANPTSKSCEKFLINAQLELKVELIPLLINVLRSQTTVGPDREDFNIVGCYENWKKEEQRLVLRTAEYGAKELLIQKKTKVLQDEDMVFSDDAEQTPMQTTSLEEENSQWEDQFGSFYIKKTDSIPDMVKALNVFYSNTGLSTSTTKKRKPAQKKNKETEIGAKKPKPKEIKINDDDDDVCDDELCESVYFNLINNNDALLELAYYYDMCGLSLENCILCYHDQMNEGINISERINFFSLLLDLNELKMVEDVLNQIIKRK